MKQWGLAMHNHHDSHNVFPAGVNEFHYMVPFLSAHILLMPYMEQGAMYDILLNYASSEHASTQSNILAALDPDVSSTLPPGLPPFPAARGLETGADDPLGMAAEFRRQVNELGPITGLLCPSDGDGRSMNTLNRANPDRGTPSLQNPRCNITPSSGDAIRYNGLGKNDDAANGAIMGYMSQVEAILNSTGEMPTKPLLNAIKPHNASAARGMFMPFSKKGMNAVSDGTSNTVAAMEAVGGPDRDDRGEGRSATGAWSWNAPVKEGFARYTEIVAEQNDFGPGACLGAGVRNGSNRSELANSTAGHRRGRTVFYGTGDTRSTTILPPNNVSCTFDEIFDFGFVSFAAGVTSDAWLLPVVATPSSNHTGGVNCVFADGAVRFVPDSIDYQPTGTRSDGSARDWTDWNQRMAGVAGGNAQVPTGQSLYGVWGALGTPAGRESKSL